MNRSMALRRLLDDPAAPALTVAGLTSDSRRVRTGDLFIAVRGAAFDGHDFAAEAVAGGAVGVVSERQVQVAVPNVVVADVAGRLGELGRRFYQAPSRELEVIGVTGTNGKTTVAYNAARIGVAGAYIGTLGWGRPPALCPSTLTTADPIALQAELRTLKDGGIRRVALEVSSHALDQGRVDEVDFAIGVFTNLSRDHLDYHGAMLRYGAAKKKLFQRRLGAAVVNVDDPLGVAIADELAAAAGQVDVFRVGRKAAVRWSDIAYGRDGIGGVWITPWGRRAFSLPTFFGEFSVYNAACALAASCALGTSLSDAVDAMARLAGVPGRMQIVARDPLVAVDYAHTPDALRAALAAARAHLAPGGRVIVVFGCGGDRDPGKRAPMAQAAEAGADVVVATSDNPRREDPERILDQVMAGFRAVGAVLRIEDRRRAIATALNQATPSDLVLVAGKGHEEYQDIAGRKQPFSDAGVVRELVQGGNC